MPSLISKVARDNLLVVENILDFGPLWHVKYVSGERGCQHSCLRLMHHLFSVGLVLVES